MRHDLRIVIYSLGPPEIQRKVVDLHAAEGESWWDILRRGADQLEAEAK